MRGPTGVRYQRSTEALSRRIGSDVLVTVPADERVHELSGGASAVWADLSEPRTVVELVGRLAQIHGVARDVVAGQIARCIDTFLALGLVQEEPGFDV